MFVLKNYQEAENSHITGDASFSNIVHNVGGGGKNPVNVICEWSLIQVLPDPGYDNKPVIGPGGSIFFRKSPKHHGILNGDSFPIV